MKKSFYTSVAFKYFLKSIFFGVLAALFTYLLRFLPQDDLLQALWIFFTTTFSAFVIFKKQIEKFEKKEDRWKKLARDMLEIHLEEDPHLISTLLLAKDIPERWVDWINEMYHFDFLQCRLNHAVDSLVHANDLPGQGLTRVTRWIADVLHDLETASPEIKQEAVSKALEKLVDTSQEKLGTVYHPGFYYQKIESGNLPYGIFMDSHSKGAISLATTYKKKIKVEQKTQEVNCARLGFNLPHLTQEQWEKLVDEIDHHFPCFHRQNLGSGPRSITSQLFVQESHSVETQPFVETLKKLPGILQKYLPPPALVEEKKP